MPSDELRYKLLKLLENNPGLSQRQLAAELGASLGSTHYALSALVERGWIKAQNFRRSDRKRAYLYKLTPAGIAGKTRLAHRFLRRKREEHAALMEEIEALRAEVGDSESPAPEGES